MRILVADYVVEGNHSIGSHRNSHVLEWFYLASSLYRSAPVSDGEVPPGTSSVIVAKALDSSC